MEILESIKDKYCDSINLFGQVYFNFSWINLIIEQKDFKIKNKTIFQIILILEITQFYVGIKYLLQSIGL